MRVLFVFYLLLLPVAIDAWCRVIERVDGVRAARRRARAAREFEKLSQMEQARRTVEQTRKADYDNSVSYRYLDKARGEIDATVR